MRSCAYRNLKVRWCIPLADNWLEASSTPRSSLRHVAVLALTRACILIATTAKGRRFRPAGL